MITKFSTYLLVAVFSIFTGCVLSNSRVVPPASKQEPAGFYVSGRHLYDRCGDQVVLRGVNEMVVWTKGRDGTPEFGEIAKTGANAVRIVWSSVGSAQALSTAISNAVKQQLIPIIENHDATGDLRKLNQVIDWWTRPDIVRVVNDHAPYLIVNIANEAGDHSVTASQFLRAYKRAITRMRRAGINTTLIIDAPHWGQNIDIIQATGQELIDHDPLSNLMLSVHMWWSDPNGTRVVTELQESVDLGLPLIVGEFAQHAVSGCADNPFDYGTLLNEAQRHSIGWLAWSWGGLDNADCAKQGSFDMTIDGHYGQWEEAWAEQVALTHPFSIANTSIRPDSMVHGQCRAEPGR